MFNIILNYIVRFSFIVIGVFLLFGIFIPEHPSKTLSQAMGVVFILWGLYRLISYYFQLKKRRAYESEE